jgi:hypothetical protein
MSILSRFESIMDPMGAAARTEEGLAQLRAELDSTGEPARTGGLALRRQRLMLILASAEQSLDPALVEQTGDE